MFKQPEAILFRVYFYDLYDNSDQISYTTWAADEHEAINNAVANVERRYVVDYTVQVWPKKGGKNYAF